MRDRLPTLAGLAALVLVVALAVSGRTDQTGEAAGSEPSTASSTTVSTVRLSPTVPEPEDGPDDEEPEVVVRHPDGTDFERVTPAEEGEEPEAEEARPPRGDGHPGKGPPEWVREMLKDRGKGPGRGRG